MASAGLEPAVAPSSWSSNEAANWLPWSSATALRRRDAEDSPALRMPDPVKFKFDPEVLDEETTPASSSSSSGANSSSNSVSLIDDRMVRVGSRADRSDINALLPVISECWRFQSSPPYSISQRAKTAASSSAVANRSSGLLAIILSIIATRSLGASERVSLIGFGDLTWCATNR